MVSLTESSLPDGISVVESITQLDDESVERPLDSDDTMELQQSSLNSITNHATYLIDPSENIATFTFKIREFDLEQAVERREKNDNFPDEVSPEFVIGRELEWIASTINNGQHLRRHIGYVSHDDYEIEVSSGDSDVVVNIVFHSSE